MKIVTASNGKRTVKMNKADWQKIGRTAGWLEDNFKEDHYDSDENKNPYESVEFDEAVDELVRQGMLEKKSKNDYDPEEIDLIEKEIYQQRKNAK